MKRLDGKIALVTGGNGGIGLAIARRFVDEGAQVVITGRRETALQHAAELIGSNVTTAAGDLILASDRERLFDTIRRTHGKLDIVIANAGSMEHGRIEDVSEDHYDRTFDLNARSTLFTVQSAASLLSDGGAIVLIGSVATTLGTPGFGVYAASKAAVRSYARTWASELAPRRIRVNALSPGPVQTAMYDSLSEDVRTTITASIPLGRPGRAEEIAAAALFLASDEASFITGVELFADGGMTQA